ncbi:MAG: hypothetical protein O2924_01460 [Chloroflexi bacterium]|nr:hypothetical protein [Chloroflexota bacterium]MQC25625.1 hypothetical protein [Chloroflexota bacterium]
MTSPEGRRDRAQPLHLELPRQEAGTLLGALAWAMGAIQIMRDRGHAEGEHSGTEYDKIYQQLQPRLERIVERIAKARMDSVTRPEFEEGIEAAYADVRQAFEEWIRLTAIDTLGAAMAAHMEDGEDLDLEDIEGFDDVDETHTAEGEARS